MSKTYSVVETFPTLQGEGHHVGTAATFVRLAGCNQWSGDDEDRQRDAVRNGSLCPYWCDTDFKPREHLTAQELAARISPRTRMVVITGGEPLLQVDDNLLDCLVETHGRRLLIAIETNGTVKLRSKNHQPWITCSPKLPAHQLKIDPQQVSELKVVFPSYDPGEYRGWASENPAMRLFVQPEASTLSIGKSIIAQDNVQKAVRWCIENPEWRLSLQTHKMIGLP